MAGLVPATDVVALQRLDCFASRPTTKRIELNLSPRRNLDAKAREDSRGVYSHILDRLLDEHPALRNCADCQGATRGFDKADERVGRGPGVGVVRQQRCEL